MEQLLKYFEVVAELHKMGYEQIRMSEYVTPNGAAMRCWITVKSRCWNKFGGFVLILPFSQCDVRCIVNYFVTLDV